MLVYKVAIVLMALGLPDRVRSTYVHLNEKCFLKASHRYCQQHHPGYLRGCQARLDRKNLVMNAEDSTICFIGNSNGRCISNDVCLGSEITTASTRATSRRATTPTSTTTTTTRPTPVLMNAKHSEHLPEQILDADSVGEWPFQHPETEETTGSHQEWNPFSVLGLTTPIEIVLFGTLIALAAMLMLYMIVLGCQLTFIRAQKRTYKSLDAILNKTFKHLIDLEQDLQERGLRIQPSSTVAANSDGPAILSTLPAQNSFQPDGPSALARAGSTGTIPKPNQVKSARGTGSLFGSLTRVKPPTAPPLPPATPRRSQRGASGQRRTQNSLPALNQFDEIEMEESHV